MTWQGVPWFVAGGIHPPEVARLLAYASVGGAEGVVGIDDLKVSELDVPAGSIRVAPGAGLIPNRKTGGGQQTYVARNPDDDVVSVTATGSGSGRSDLVIARIEDPQYPGSAEPGDPEVGPYIFTRIIEDVPSTATRVQDISGHETDAAITLARITLPESTGTVLDSHITDLRKLAQARKQLEIRTTALLGSDTDEANAGDSNGELWPNIASWEIDIPLWATHARIIATWAQVKIPAGNATGQLWSRLGNLAADPAPETQKVKYDNPGNAGVTRTTFVVADEVSIPSEIRGTTVDAQMRSRSLTGTSYPIADGASAVSYQIDFFERAV